MSTALFLKTYDAVRGITLNNIKKTEETIADIFPDKFNNNLRWQFGHILTSQEGLLYRADGQYFHLPEEYKGWFGNGSKPREWTGELPSLEQLAAQLQEQKERVSREFAERLEEEFSQPVVLGSGLSFATYGELLTFTFFHEGMHQGYINSMKRLLG